MAGDGVKSFWRGSPNVEGSNPSDTAKLDFALQKFSLLLNEKSDRYLNLAL